MSKFNYKYLIIILLLFIVIVFLFLNRKKIDFFGKSTTYLSTIDGNKYVVRTDPLNVSLYTNLDDPTKVGEKSGELAANYLANIKKKIDILVDYMYEHKLPDIERSTRLYSRWKKCILRETDSGETSVAYTVNKGDEMRLCIRNKDKLENENTSIFVVIHELGHLMSISYNHTEEFRDNFSYIIHLASELGIYTPQNFHLEPVNYCGMEINTTPCSNGTCTIK